METLNALQGKIEQLLAVIKELKEANNVLDKENKQLAKKLLSIESTVASNEQDVKELSDEKARVKMVIDDLIKSIYSCITIEKQP